MAATVWLSLIRIIRSAATGIAELQRRRAGLAVACGTWSYHVLLAAGTGMDSGFVFFRRFLITAGLRV